MYTLLRSLLFRLDPETAHHLTLQLMRLAGHQPLMAVLQVLFSTPYKPVEAFGLTFKNPVGLAAGYDKDAAALRGLANLGFSHVEVGTVTPRPQPGNPRPRLFRLVEDEAVINRMGFPSQGAEKVMRTLKKHYKARLRRPNIVLGVNLGKNKDTPNDEAVFDYLELLGNFAPLADYLTINVSSPNTVGLRQLQGREALYSLLSQLDHQRKLEEKRLEKRIPLLVKLAPDLSDADLESALDVILSANMDGVVATNTTLTREGLRSPRQMEAGGLSGSPLRVQAEAVLDQAVRRVNGQIPVISAGGIMGPDDAKRRLDKGAALVQVYTGLVYAGPGLVKKIVRGV
ncbi:MAG: quinone-dependent dihydroorotate dehydrogenase [Chloroflexota bacterium]